MKPGSAWISVQEGASETGTPFATVPGLPNFRTTFLSQIARTNTKYLALNLTITYRSQWESLVGKQN